MVLRSLKQLLQLCSYVGLTPTTRKSGSSVRGISRISIGGNRKLCNLCFYDLFNPRKYNKESREVFMRLIKSLFFECFLFLNNCS